MIAYKNYTSITI